MMAWMELVPNALAFVCLLYCTHVALKMKKLTEKASPAWLLISVGLAFLTIYALTNIIEFGLEVSTINGILKIAEEPIGISMDRAEMGIVNAGAAFLVAAGLTLKHSVIKPI